MCSEQWHQFCLLQLIVPVPSKQQILFFSWDYYVLLCLFNVNQCLSRQWVYSTIVSSSSFFLSFTSEINLLYSTSHLSFVLYSDKGLSGTGSPNTASMGLFRDSSFRQTYPEGPLTLTVGSALYFGVSVDEPDPSFSLVLDTCYISNSSNPDDSNQYYLITSRYLSTFVLKVVEMRTNTYNVVQKWSVPL